MLSYKTCLRSLSLSAITLPTGCVLSILICFDEAGKKIVPGRRVLIGCVFCVSSARPELKVAEKKTKRFYIKISENNRERRGCRRSLKGFPGIFLNKCFRNFPRQQVFLLIRIFSRVKRCSGMNISLLGENLVSAFQILSSYMPNKRKK